MSVSINNTIHQRGPFTRIELAAAAGLSPGHMLEETSSGTLQKATLTGTIGHERIWAVEDALNGNTTATAYATGDMVQANVEERGNLIQAMCHAGTNYTVGMRLSSNGDGTLKRMTVSSDVQIATVVTANDLSVSGAVDSLVQVRVM